MKNKKTRLNKIIALLCLAGVGVTTYILRTTAEKESYSATLVPAIEERKKGLYEKYIKRILDIICAVSALVILSPIYAVVAILVKRKLGSPVLFTQKRPGMIGRDGRETIFKMYKFRTMTDEMDENGNLLSDEIRLTPFGKKLRSTSLDELPEIINILNGTMSVIGPRPQLVRDMVFMSDHQRLRHTAKPGLSGLAQVNGRNAITWENKLDWDLKYIRNISFSKDIGIVLMTLAKIVFRREKEEETELALDYGDELLTKGIIGEKEYAEKQEVAKTIIKKELDE